MVQVIPKRDFIWWWFAMATLANGIGAVLTLHGHQPGWAFVFNALCAVNAWHLDLEEAYHRRRKNPNT
jgi:hypothetical protein